MTSPQKTAAQAANKRRSEEDTTPPPQDGIQRARAELIDVLVMGWMKPELYERAREEINLKFAVPDSLNKRLTQAERDAQGQLELSPRKVLLANKDYSLDEGDTPTHMHTPDASLDASLDASPEQRFPRYRQTRIDIKNSAPSLSQAVSERVVSNGDGSYAELSPIKNQYAPQGDNKTERPSPTIQTPGASPTRSNDTGLAVLGCVIQQEYTCFSVGKDENATVSFMFMLPGTKLEFSPESSTARVLQAISSNQRTAAPSNPQKRRRCLAKEFESLPEKVMSKNDINKITVQSSEEKFDYYDKSPVAPEIDPMNIDTEQQGQDNMDIENDITAAPSIIFSR